MPEIIFCESLTHDMMNEFFKRIQTRLKKIGRNTLKSGVKDSTIRTYWNKLNCFFVWLQIHGHISKNPLGKVKPPEPVYDDSRALENSDIQKLFAAITLHSQNTLILKRDTLMISLLVFCGLRKGEFISLQVRDVDIEKGMLTVRGETSKSKKTRYIPMHKTLMLHLQEYIRERNKIGYKAGFLLVSNNDDSRLTVHGLHHWIKRLSNLSGVKFHLHRFRHTFACTLANKNVGLIKIQKLMGHADPKMTASYLRSITTEDLRDDIEKLSI
jgi:integrase